jgi:hypothetical protein
LQRLRLKSGLQSIRTVLSPGEHKCVRSFHFARAPGSGGQEGCERSAHQEFIDIVRPRICYVENIATRAGSVDVHEAVARARLNQSSAGFVEKPLDGASGFVVTRFVLDHVSQDQPLLVPDNICYSAKSGPRSLSINMMRGAVGTRHNGIGTIRRSGVGFLRARSTKLDPFPPSPYDRFMPLTE